MSQDKIGEAFLDDPEEELWEHLNDYVWEDLPTDERVIYAKTIYTLIKRFGHSYGEILARTGWSESAGGLAKRIRKLLGQDSPLIEKKAIKVANKQFGEIIGREVKERVVDNYETGNWLQETYGPIAKARDIPLDQFIAQTVDYYITEKPVVEKLVEEMFFDALDQKMRLEYLLQVASPNFLAAKEMENITRFTEFITLTKACGYLH